jgi:Ohr subfamily peroxiredoxin
MPVAETPLTSASDFDPLYTTTVRVAGGAAREVRSDDGNLQLELSAPEALGVAGAGTNPGPLFAASYASCFHGILVVLGDKAGADMRDAVVRVTAAYRHDPSDGLDMMTADIAIELPHVSKQLGEELVRNAERACPYAKMAQQGTRCVVTGTAP